MRYDIILNYYWLFNCYCILVVELRPIDILLKKLLDTIANTYQRNNFGTMKTWSSPKKLGEDNNEANVFNYLTLVTLLFTKIVIFIIIIICEIY